MQFHNLGWVHRDGQARRKIEAEIGVVLSRLSPREFDSLLSWESISQTCGATKESRRLRALKLRARGVRRDHGGQALIADAQLHLREQAIHPDFLDVTE